MGISPWYLGDTSPAWQISLMLDTGVFSTASLTPANFLLSIHNDDIDTKTTGTGTFQTLVAATITTPASIIYVPSVADTSTIGDFTLSVVITYPNGTRQTLKIQETWRVVPKW